MKFSIKNLFNIINSTNKINTNAGFMPTVFDANPDSMKLVDSFIEKMFYKQMYFYINNIKVDSSISKEVNVFYNANYVSFLLYLSRNFSESDSKYDINTNTAMKIKNQFYKDIVNSVITQISPMLKTLFYRNYNCFSIPKINIKTQKKKVNIFKQLIQAFKSETNDINDIQTQMNQLILDIYIEKDEIFVDYILDWIKMKLDLLSAELITWRKMMINELPIFSILKDINLLQWRSHDVLAETNQPKDEISNCLDILVSYAEYDLFIKKLNKMMNLDNYNN